MKPSFTLDSSHVIGTMLRLILFLLVVSISLNAFIGVGFGIAGVSDSEIEAVILGSSHGHNLDLSIVGKKGLDLADTSGDLIEADMKSKAAFERYPSLKTVFLFVSPGYFSYINKDHETKERKQKIINNTPLSISAFSYYPIGFLRRILEELFPVVKFQVEFIGSIKKYIGVEVKSTDNKCFDNLNVDTELEIRFLYQKKLARIECIEQFARETVELHDSLIESTLLKFPNVTEENISRVTEIAKILSGRKGKLILIVPPLTRAYFDSPAIQSRLLDHMAILKKLDEISNVEVYDFHDYFTASFDTGVNKYFYDDNHLALPGVLEFSLAIKNEMR